MEEAGEFAQCVGKLQGLNGEHTMLAPGAYLDKASEELLDVMQVCATMIYLLEEKHNIKITDKFNQHIEKLKLKGYLK